ncbi:hypothetical protein HMPREF1225_1897 [Streptococcus pyogenes UTSW-2]|nr:hypothetical protein HMPREF1225_1897 [Streptococcus pyogenes UTSW-2]
MDFEFYREKLNEEPGIEPGKPKTWSAIKSKLVAYRREWLEEAGKDVKNLSELAVAIGINKFLHVITLETGKWLSMIQTKDITSRTINLLIN